MSAVVYDTGAIEGNSLMNIHSAFLHNEMLQLDHLLRHVFVAETERQETMAREYEEASMRTGVDLDVWSWEISHELIPNLLSGAQLSMLMAYLEHQMTVLSRMLGPAENTKLHLKDIHGKGIQRAWTFLTQGHGMDLSAVDKYWQFLKKAALVRNRVIHAGHHVSPEDSSLNVYIESHEGLSLNTDGQVVIELHYLLKVLDSLRTVILYAHVQAGNLPDDTLKDLELDG